jgi:predicted nucleic acid-binding protein
LGSSSLRTLRPLCYLCVPLFSSRRIAAASDPGDNIFLECADAARADYLITANPRHFPPFWKQSKIISSRQFITLAAPHLAPQ